MASSIAFFADNERLFENKNTILLICIALGLCLYAIQVFVFLLRIRKDVLYVFQRIENADKEFLEEKLRPFITTDIDYLYNKALWCLTVGDFAILVIPVFLIEVSVAITHFLLTASACN